MNKFLLASLASITVIAPLAHSKNIPLEEATITRIVNDVRILDPKQGTAPARVSQVVKDDMGVKTGIKSRAELLFQDNTLTRLGAESYFTFRPGTREMSLDAGTLLLQVPKDHGGARIRSASITASITGTTILLETIPGKSVKILVLEGSLRLSLNNRLGETLSLRAGKMIIHRPGDKTLPEPVNVNLRRLIKTSSLVNPELFSAKNKPAPLPSMPLIAAAISEQDAQRAKGNLQDTNLVILGKGTKVIAASAETMRVLAGVTVSTDSRVNPESGAEQTTTATSTTTGTASTNTPLGGLPGSGAASGGAVQNTQAAATAATAATPGLDGTTKSIGRAGQPFPGDVDINSPVDVSTGNIPAGAPPGGIGGIFKIFTTGRARIASNVEVSSNSPTRRSASGGSIHIESLQSNSGGSGIEVSNTSQLLSLLNSAAPGPGGKIEFITSGSKILLGGQIQADRGTITVANNGPAGEIRIEQANLAANVIKVSVLQPGGLLRIGDSHITADSLLQLYGGSGTGGVRFTGNTLLDGNSLKFIAGNQVQIDSGRVVTIGGGPATVFTNIPSYSSGSGGNGSTSGRFERQTAPGTAYAPLRLPYQNRP